MPLKIRNASSTESEIIIYAPIGASMWEDSISAKQFQKELAAIPDSCKKITVRINSPGGDVFDGIAIYNLLKTKKQHKTVCVDAMAASIASIIAMAGDEIVMSEGSQMMIHKPWCYTGGNSEELEKTIQRLDDIEEQMLSIYRSKTKMDRSELRAMLREETWMDADKCLEMGFATSKMAEDDEIRVAASCDKAVWIKNKPKFDNKKLENRIDTLKLEIEKYLKKK